MGSDDTDCDAQQTGGVSEARQVLCPSANQNGARLTSVKKNPPMSDWTGCETHPCSRPLRHWSGHRADLIRAGIAADRRDEKCTT